MAEYILNINDELEKKSFKILADYGLTPIQAFNIFLEKVAELKTLPFDYKNKSFEPNEETQKAILEGRADYEAGRLKGYTNLDEMFEDLLKDD